MTAVSFSYVSDKASIVSTSNSNFERVNNVLKCICEEVRLVVLLAISHYDLRNKAIHEFSGSVFSHFQTLLEKVSYGGFE